MLSRLNNPSSRKSGFLALRRGLPRALCALREIAHKAVRSFVQTSTAGL
jgi:hypothetical protein